MSTLDNSGPAFPAVMAHISDFPPGSTNLPMGMTLRDYFAAKALPIAWQAFDEGYFGHSDTVNDDVAKCAYQFADAMLKARQS